MLKLTNISKDYFITKELTTRALDNVSIDFRENEFVSILGPSGCGKTTLLNLIGGLDSYTDGDMTIDDISTTSYKERQWNSYRNNRIGFVFQSYNLIPHQSVVGNVELALTLSGIGKIKRRQMAIDALTEVGLEAELYKKPNQLSGGQMQRVAIARALVNNPQIVLADEPTGALDSVTSVQIMELLANVAKSHLVIMVTHNGELAEEYSTRIIKLKDGKIVKDTNPYDTSSEQPAQDYSKTGTTNASPTANTMQSAPPKVQMSFWTALLLSFKNLMTKKGRTFMTSFAGSIGIIGVALVLALNYGFNIYIADVQSNMLGSMPVQISTTTSDLSAMQDDIVAEVLGLLSSNVAEYPSWEDIIIPYNSSSTTTYYYNYVDDSFMSYMQQLTDDNPDWLSDTVYSYAYGLKTFTEYNGNYTEVSSSRMQMSINNTDYVLSQYDVLSGYYPTQSNEIAIIVDSYNRISISYLNGMLIPYTETLVDGETEYGVIDIQEVLDKTYYVIGHDDYWYYNGSSYQNIYARYAQTDRNTYISGLSDSDSTIELTVTAVLRAKEDATSTLFNTGYLYLPSLMEEYVDMNSTSEVAQAQADVQQDGNVYRLSGNYMSLYSIDYLINGDIDNNNDGLIATLPNITLEGAYQYYYQYSGVSTVPWTLSYYPESFNDKSNIIDYIDAWNDDNPDQQIVYTDLVTIVTSIMEEVIDIICYVLLAIAAISLLVSSVMIGIITYVSVIERTKEIGVLRSMGASKMDISNVFNAEAFIIGLISGILGVGLTYLLCIPLNALLITIGAGAISSNLAILPISSALVLIGISCVLTLVAGAIPARFAANLDPVKALRSE